MCGSVKDLQHDGNDHENLKCEDLGASQTNVIELFGEETMTVL